MKKIRVFTLAILLFFLSTNVYAVCDVTESNTLNSLAVNVSANYEVIEKEVPIDENYNFPDGMNEELLEDYVATREYFRIYIANVTEDLYVIVKNQGTGEEVTYTFADVVDGIITFDADIYVVNTNYTIEIYSSDETNCPDTKLYTLYLTLPAFNPYSETAYCEGIEDFYMCHKYLSVDVDFSTFYEDTENYRNGLIDGDGEEITEPVEGNGFLEFLGDHLVIVIVIVVIIVAAGGLITFVVIRKQRRRIV